MTIEFVDDGIEFDPTKKERPKTPKNFDEVEIGGCGILLAKNYADELVYDYINGENHLKIIKKVEI